MRKEDRVRASKQQSRPDESSPQSQDRSSPIPRSTEQMKGSATDQPSHPPRPHGKLPLPD